jgi:hypothetical protein
MPPPREVYNAIYVYSATSREAAIAVGPDDGIRVWWDGSVVIDLATCQGTIPDFVTAPVSMTAGWHTLLLKVRDQGGGWGKLRSLPRSEGRADHRPRAVDDRRAVGRRSDDSDGDGEGDACDLTPTG